MGSVKLSKETRDGMAKDIIKVIYKDRIDRNHTRSLELFEMVWEDIFCDEVKEHIKKMPTIFQLKTYFNIDCGGRGPVQIDRPENAGVYVGRVPGQGILSQNSNYLKLSMLSGSVAKAIREYLDEIEQVRIESNELKEKLRSFFYGFNTTGQLLAAWPSLLTDFPIVAGWIDKGPSRALVVPDASAIKDALNKAIKSNT